jgi:peptidyl-dipeptidase Dcp
MDDLGRLCVARTAQVVHIATDRRTAGVDAAKTLIVHSTNGSARSNRLQMAGTPAAVYELLNEVWTPALDRAKEEMAEMNAMLQRDVPGATFEPWDWWYYAEKVRKDKYALDDAALRPYFSLENVREGAFSLANRLYGITFRPLVAPVYHKDCSVYEVLDVDGTHLGVLYFDFFPRSGKSSGAWCTAFRSQRYEGDERIAPVVAIVCNFTPPTKLTPSLLTLDEVQTLFHEFGHGLHALFADVKYRSLGRVEGDFVELPSQIMENWATEPEVLRHYAINYTTGEVIPERLIKRIRESGKFNQGFIVTELVAAALTDMDIHAITEYEPFDVNEFEADAVYGRRGLIPQIQPRYRYPYFLHIFDGGYASGYYFYIWAQVLDKDAFRAFEQTGDVFDRATARKFRTLLSRGGSADGMTLYRDFRGADPDKRAMLVACGLMEELPEEPADSLAVPVVTLEPNEKPKI